MIPEQIAQWCLWELQRRGVNRVEIPSEFLRNNRTLVNAKASFDQVKGTYVIELDENADWEVAS